MNVRTVPPTRLRRRLAVVFVLAVGISTGALAVGSYLVVRSARLSDSANRDVDQSKLELRFAASQHPAPQLLFQEFAERGSFATVIEAPDRTAERSGRFGPRQVPGDLAALVANGKIARERIVVAGHHYVVVGSKMPGSEERFYFFYDDQQVWNDLTGLRNVLAGGWLTMVVLAALAGTLLARRTLAPLGQASDAARSLAEGMLDTRLPVETDDEFGAWAGSFNEMADALKAKIDALAEARAREQRFTANVAHELMTPVTGLVGETRLLAQERETMSPRAGQLADLLAHDVDRLRQLTEDLLEVSRLDAGTEPAAIEPVDLVAAISGVVRSRGWADRVEVAATPIVVNSDPRRLDRILANLIGNAIRHGGDRVRVDVTQSNGHVKIDVADDGAGIPADSLPHIFDRFYKADQSRSSGGSGLGLAIARENARLMGGDIVAASGAQTGTVFTVTLPVAESLSESDRAVAERPDDGATPSEARHDEIPQP
jgi:signal transduction histidine kinase